MLENEVFEWKFIEKTVKSSLKSDFFSYFCRKSRWIIQFFALKTSKLSLQISEIPASFVWRTCDALNWRAFDAFLPLIFRRNCSIEEAEKFDLLITKFLWRTFAAFFDSKCWKFDNFSTIRMMSGVPLTHSYGFWHEISVFQLKSSISESNSFFSGAPSARFFSTQKRINGRLKKRRIFWIYGLKILKFQFLSAIKIPQLRSTEIHMFTSFGRARLLYFLIFFLK